jgi:GAF domain-containing protein
VSSQNAADGRRRDPHRVRVAAAVRELAMRAIDLAPLLKELKDRLDLLGTQAVQRPTGLAVLQAAVIAPAAPPPRPRLVQLEVLQARR